MTKEELHKETTVTTVPVIKIYKKISAVMKLDDKIKFDDLKETSKNNILHFLTLYEVSILSKSKIDLFSMYMEKELSSFQLKYNNI